MGDPSSIQAGTSRKKNIASVIMPMTRSTVTDKDTDVGICCYVHLFGESESRVPFVAEGDLANQC